MNDSSTPEPPSGPGAQPEPGWYANPTGPGRRYWDGEKWTESYAPEEVPPDREGDSISLTTKVGLGAAVALAVGSGAPWVSSPFITVSGLDGDGVLTLILAGISAPLLFFFRKARHLWVPIVVGVLGAGALAITVWDFVQVQGTTSDFFGEEVKLASAGWGLWVALIAAGTLAVSAWVRVAELVSPGAPREKLTSPSVASIGLALTVLAVAAVGVGSGIDAAQVCVSSETGSRVDCDDEDAVSEEEYDEIEAERQAQEEREEAEREAEAAAAECELEVSLLLDDLAELNRDLGSGISLEDYLSQLDSMSFSQDLISTSSLTTECHDNVLVPAEEAAQAYARAGAIWEGCAEDPDCPDDSIDPKLQRRWDEADAARERATSQLSFMSVP